MNGGGKELCVFYDMKSRNDTGLIWHIVHSRSYGPVAAVLLIG
jgi:hypothetical protein